MNSLVKELRGLERGPVKKEVENRLLEFESFQGKPAKEWFSELCFCLLTANSKAETAIAIQKELGAKGFAECAESGVSKCIRLNKHRFHNNKARFIVEARQHHGVKKIIQGLVESDGEEAAREWLVQTVKGLGYKEASHFMRNVGYKNLAILDRHILNLMLENGFIAVKPKPLNRETYLGIEAKFRKIAQKLGHSPAELDLYMWYLKTGKVLK